MFYFVAGFAVGAVAGVGGFIAFIDKMVKEGV